MMTHLLAEIRTSREKLDANQAKVDAVLREMREDIKTNQAKADANLREIRASQELLKEEMLDRLDAHH
jgi:outer membrane protein TolC